MASSRTPLVIGPFSGGLNTYDDPTAVKDTELVECLNWDPGLEGSLRSRPPFTDRDTPMPLGATGNMRFLGFFYGTGNTYYLIASDGLSSTWRYDGTAWALITSTFSATAIAQFDNKAWLTSPVGEADPGGYWTPGGGFVADANMPHGDSIVSFKSRLWVTPGRGNTNGTRVYYSKVLGQPDFWLAPSFVDVGQGDGQDIVLLTTWYNTLVAFRTQSIYAFSFNADPAQGAVALLVPGIGLDSKECLIAYEGYMYFMYDGKGYQFINNNAQQINIKVPFTATGQANNTLPFSVSLFNNRVIFHYYDTMYVFSLRTKTWTRWKSPQHGSIGQIMSPAGVLTDEAFVNPSLSLPVSMIPRKNLIKRPRPVADGDWQVPGGVLDTSFVRRPGSTSLKKVCTAAEPQFIQAAFWPPGSTVATGGTPVTAGKTYTASAYASASVPGYQSVITVYWVSATGTLIDLSVGEPSTGGVVGTWQRATLTEEAPVGAVSAVTISTVSPSSGESTVGDIAWVQDPVLNEGTTPDDYYDGGTPDTPYIDYSWEGTADESVSLATNKRVAPLLYISDEFTNATESYTCEIQTKNYNYQLSSNFKRLFWWGVDAVFRTRIRGWAVPVVHHTSTTWGALVAGNVTWGQLLGGTWGSPFLGDLSIETDYNLGGTGPVRKFVKMFSSMRFRQIYFRLIFDTDGSIGTAPVNLFTLTAYMDSKETVSKAVS